MNAPSARDASSSRIVVPALELQELDYHYPDGRHALRGLSFTIARGQTVGLVGPNGAGKTTLLLHLNGLLPERLPAAKAASTRVLGMPVTPRHLPAIRRAVGLLFQDPDDQLFCPEVLEDVAFGPQQQGLTATEAQQRARQVLEQLGIAALAERIPQQLSVGEKRRVCLAGVLTCQPEILALDEPTSNLDPRGRRQLLGLLATLPQTKLLATHDLEMVLHLCDRVLLLDEGELIADGPPRQLLANVALMERHGLEVPTSLGGPAG